MRTCRFGCSVDVVNNNIMSRVDNFTIQHIASRMILLSQRVKYRVNQIKNTFVVIDHYN